MYYACTYSKVNVMKILPKFAMKNVLIPINFVCYEIRNTVIDLVSSILRLVLEPLSQYYREACNWKACEKSWQSEYGINDPIKWQICTWHDSWAVMPCANLWPDLFIIFQVRVTWILTHLLNACHFADMLKYIFLNENILISNKFHWNMFLGV